MISFQSGITKTNTYIKLDFIESLKNALKIFTVLFFCNYVYLVKIFLSREIV